MTEQAKQNFNKFIHQENWENAIKMLDPSANKWKMLSILHDIKIGLIPQRLQNTEFFDLLEETYNEIFKP